MTLQYRHNIANILTLEQAGSSWWHFNRILHEDDYDVWSLSFTVLSWEWHETVLAHVKIAREKTAQKYFWQFDRSHPLPSNVYWMNLLLKLFLVPTWHGNQTQKKYDTLIFHMDSYIKDVTAIPHAAVIVLLKLHSYLVTIDKRNTLLNWLCSEWRLQEVDISIYIS